MTVLQPFSLTHNRKATVGDRAHGQPHRGGRSRRPRRAGCFGIGEHHRVEFLDSAPAIILAAVAARTKQIRLTSAVTVLSAADPVRVFQEFATLDLIAKGRAEIVVGRGSFAEAFPLFGMDGRDYDDLFAQKLDLLVKLGEANINGRVASVPRSICRASIPDLIRRDCRSGSASAERPNPLFARVEQLRGKRSASPVSTRRPTMRRSSSRDTSTPT